MEKSFDLIVIGTGGFGSSVVFHAARCGARVLGLDRFPPGHDRGSSHGQTRIIRQAYFEHSDYVPLLLRAYEQWFELEELSGKRLLTQCGLLEAGPSQGEVVGGVRRAAQLHNLQIENYSASEAERRFPGFRFDEDHEVVFEPQAGFLKVEECVLTHIAQAQAAGAVCESGVIVREWSSDGSRVRVTTDRETYEAAALVLTPGAWAPDLLASVSGMPKLEVRRKVLVWSPVRSPNYDVTRGGVAFLYELPEGVFYGFPTLGDGLLKFGEHTGGEPVSDPVTVDRALHDSDLSPLLKFSGRYMPDLEPRVSAHAICLYTMSPDANFVVDRHPDYRNVFFGAGFSGHGFKFTSVLGSALSELALSGSTSAPIEFLSLGRFS